MTLFLFLQAILDSSLSLETLRDAQWSIAILLSSGLVSGYYFSVIREDRRAISILRPETRTRRKRVTAAVPVDLRGIVEQLEAVLGYEVRVWLLDRVNQPATLGHREVQDAGARIGEGEPEHFLVVVRPGSLEVLPFRPD